MDEPRRGVAVWIATAAGIGYCPVIPGTAGSLAGLAFIVALDQATDSRMIRPAAAITSLAFIFALGVWASGRAENFFGRKDPSQVVIDEVAGQILAFAPWSVLPVKWLVGSFVCFRILDVLKPFPAGRCERLPGGWGIMMDDIVAGVYTALAAGGIHYFAR